MGWSAVILGRMNSLKIDTIRTVRKKCEATNTDDIALFQNASTAPPPGMQTSLAGMRQFLKSSSVRNSDAKLSWTSEALH